MTETLRFALLADLHLAPPESSDGEWNNAVRLSASHQLLEAALDEIVAAGHHQVIVLGDLANQGQPHDIRRVQETLARVGLRTFGVPGNHDVIESAEASINSPGQLWATWCPPDEINKVALRGCGLRSRDKGVSCEAIDLPDLDSVSSRMLIWLSHYPVLSAATRMAHARLRYPGDLINLGAVQGCVSAFRGPVLALHGHLHASVVAHSRRLLQIGVPALVEWPHAWTDLTVELSGDAIAVRYKSLRVSGSWSNPVVNTVLDPPAQDWEFSDQRWRPGDIPTEWRGR